MLLTLFQDVSNIWRKRTSWVYIFFGHCFRYFTGFEHLGSGREEASQKCILNCKA